MHENLQMYHLLSKLKVGVGGLNLSHIKRNTLHRLFIWNLLGSFFIDCFWHIEFCGNKYFLKEFSILGRLLVCTGYTRNLFTMSWYMYYGASMALIIMSYFLYSPGFLTSTTWYWPLGRRSLQNPSLKSAFTFSAVGMPPSPLLWH